MTTAVCDCIIFAVISQGRIIAETEPAGCRAELDPLPDTDNTGVGRRLTFLRVAFPAALVFFGDRKMERSNVSQTRKLVESSILVAIATVLSIIPIVSLPYGGSITVASMLPLIIISYRHGLGWGTASGFVYGIIQQLLGLKVLGYVTTWQSVVAVIVLDYLAAFACAGLGGIFRKAVKEQSLSMTLGALCVCIARFLCHVVSGATVWAGLSIPNEAALIYSVAYNSTYMLPETIITAAAVFYIGSSLDFTASVPVRIKRSEQQKDYGWRIVGWAPAIVSVILSVAVIFSKLQNPETGEWNPAGFSEVNWLPLVIVTSASFVLAVVTSVIATKKKEK